MIKEENINCTVEALILASPEPLAIKKISDVIGDIPTARVRQAIKDLNNVYMGCGCSFRIREIAGGYQVHILPDFEQPIKSLLTKQRTVRLTRAALETLAIVAYKQPVTKTEIEHIRGVASDGVLHNLMERKLVQISGRAETPGRPLLYKTAQEFLKFFGLNRISDLPRMDEIEEMIKQAEPPKEQTVLEFGDNGNADAPPTVSESGQSILENVESDFLAHAELPTELPSQTLEMPEEDIEEKPEESRDMPEPSLQEMIAESDMFGTSVKDDTDEAPLVNTETEEEAEEKSDSIDVILPAARFETENSLEVDPEEDADDSDLTGHTPDSYSQPVDAPVPIEYSETDSTSGEAEVLSPADDPSAIDEDARS